MRFVLSVAVVLAMLGSAAAQQPTVLHAALTQPTRDSLAGEIESRRQGTAPVWIGYRVPTESFSNGWGADRTIYLESDDSWKDRHGKDGHETGEDGSRASTPRVHALILLRVADQRVGKIRIENEGRSIDAGGVAFVWLPAVPPEESIAVLKGLVRGDGQALRDAAVLAIAIHRSAATVPTLIELAAPSQDGALREKAAFWLSARETQDRAVALAAIRRFAENDPDDGFREKLTFDLTLFKGQPEALDELIRMAHRDAAPSVRRQAQFWMATVGGKEVAADLQGQAVNDPEREVRVSAVFALSRLPGDQAATQLIHTAQTSKDAEVRKQAVFWLGQSDDPRALAFLTELVKR